MLTCTGYAAYEKGQSVLSGREGRTSFTPLHRQQIDPAASGHQATHQLVYLQGCGSNYLRGQAPFTYFPYDLLPKYTQLQQFRTLQYLPRLVMSSPIHNPQYLSMTHLGEAYEEQDEEGPSPVQSHTCHHCRKMTLNLDYDANHNGRWGTVGLQATLHHILEALKAGCPFVESLDLDSISHDTSKHHWEVCAQVQDHKRDPRFPDSIRSLGLWNSQMKELTDDFGPFLEMFTPRGMCRAF